MRKSNDYKGTFDEKYTFPFTMNAWHLMFNDRAKSIIRNSVKKLKPDLIHVHDCQAMIILHGIGIPTVFDDHEYLSKQLFLEPPILKHSKVSNAARKAVRYLFRRYAYGWESMIMRDTPIIVTNERVQEDYKKRGAKKNVEVVHNFPARYQIEHLDELLEIFEDAKEGVAYCGGDWGESDSPHRDTTGLYDIVDVKVICGLPHNQMLSQLTKYKFGIVGWKPHPTLEWKNQNKCYEYMHAGCQLIIGEHLAWQFDKGLPWIHTFKTYDEIPEIIENAPDISPQRIARYARANYSWNREAPYAYSRVYEEALNSRLAQRLSGLP